MKGVGCWVFGEEEKVRRNLQYLDFLGTVEENPLILLMLRYVTMYTQVYNNFILHSHITQPFDVYVLCNTFSEYKLSKLRLWTNYTTLGFLHDRRQSKKIAKNHK